MPIITLLTDFGVKDSFIGVMKGVIWSIAPSVQIADLTHEISPQNVLEGALAISEAAPFFPAGTVHVCVVDPGVGTARRSMAALIDGQYFVGPDNGLFSLLIEKGRASGAQSLFVDLNRPEYWLPDVSRSFHGRDIFAPVAAHLAKVIAIQSLGDQFTNPVIITIPQPFKTENGWQGQVMKVDHFGNLVTNLTQQQLPVDGGVILYVGTTAITDFVTTFGNRSQGNLVSMIDSSGHLAISVVNGSAQLRLGVSSGEKVNLVFSKENT